MTHADDERGPRLGAGLEFELIERIRERLGAAAGRAGEAGVELGIGDDAAVTVPGGATATSVDALVEDVHFRRATAPPASIGRKALAAALSDLAAMGAAAGEAYVVLGVPEAIGEAECLEICDGIAALACETGTSVLGGDVTRAPFLFLAITVVGHAPSPELLVGRRGGRPGSLLVVTGELGAAAAGVLLLERPQLAAALADRLADALRARALLPTARLEAGAALAGAGAEAMIDLSDGLGGDAGHLAAAGGVGIEIDADRLPVAAGVAEVAVAAGVDPLDLAAGGGEDYELLAALPAERLDGAVAACESVGVRLSAIGKVSAEPGVRITGPSGGVRAPRGFDHLR